MQNCEDRDGEEHSDVITAGDEACVEKSPNELQEVFELFWGDQVKRVATLFTIVLDISNRQHGR